MNHQITVEDRRRTDAPIAGESAEIVAKNGANLLRGGAHDLEAVATGALLPLSSPTPVAHAEDVVLDETTTVTVVEGEAAQQLAERYAPIVAIQTQPEACGPGEPYYPADVSVILDQPDVVLLDAAGGTITQSPDAVDLLNAPEGSNFDLPGVTLRPGCDFERRFGWVQITASVMPTGTGMVFRYQDPSNYWWVDVVPQYGVLNFYRMANGVPVKMGTTPLTSFADGSTLTIRLRGNEITLFVDGFRAFGLTSPVLHDATGAGLLIDSPKAVGARFAGFAAGPLSIAGEQP